MMGAESLAKTSVQNTSQATPALEQHYSIAEVAKMWALSEKTVRRMFEDEDGVLNWGAPETRRKRGYRTLRIPESVLHRVHRKRELRAG
jgi:AraC-like DNA-binding protein